MKCCVVRVVIRSFPGGRLRSPGGGVKGSVRVSHSSHHFPQGPRLQTLPPEPAGIRDDALRERRVGEHFRLRIDERMFMGSLQLVGESVGRCRPVHWVLARSTNRPVPPPWPNACRQDDQSARFFLVIRQCYEIADFVSRQGKSFGWRQPILCDWAAHRRGFGIRKK